MKIKHFRFALSSLSGLCLLAALCSCERASPAQARARSLAQSHGEIVIAVAWPLRQDDARLANGVNLALEEINQAGGILGGRKIRLVFKDDQASLATGRMVAQEIADQPEVVAVIASLNSYIASAAARIYEQAGIVMVTPGASGQNVTEHGQHLVFRSLPGNREQGRQIAAYAKTQRYKNIAIYYMKNDDGIDLVNHFEQGLTGSGITVADRRSYQSDGDNYALVLADWAAFLKFDAIFLIGDGARCGQILREARAAGIRVPVFAAGRPDSLRLLREAGPAADGTVVFSLFNSDDPRPEVRSFSQRYQQRFGVAPDSAAAQGYDTLKLLASAMAQGNSIEPGQIASALRAMPDWRGVAGPLALDQQGEAVGKRLVRLVVRDGRFHYVAPESLP